MNLCPQPTKYFHGVVLPIKINTKKFGKLDVIQEPEQTLIGVCTNERYTEDQIESLIESIRDELAKFKISRDDMPYISLYKTTSSLLS